MGRVPGPKTLPIGRRAGFVLFLAAALAACDRGTGTLDSARAAPSASVITVGVSLGGCDDVQECERECDAGSADRCRRLAVSYAFGQGTQKNEGVATALYEHACAMGDSPACVFAGQMHEYAHGVPKDDRAAAGLYEAACTHGWAAGCYNLAILFENGRGVPTDLPKAAELYRSACTAGATTACDKAKELAAEATDGAPSGGRALP
jgi:TPR repeat protein